MMIMHPPTGRQQHLAWLGVHKAARLLQRRPTLKVPFLGRKSLLQNKRATGWSKDLADVEILEKQGER